MAAFHELFPLGEIIRSGWDGEYFFIDIKKEPYLNAEQGPRLEDSARGFSKQAHLFNEVEISLKNLLLWLEQEKKKDALSFWSSYPDTYIHAVRWGKYLYPAPSDTSTEKKEPLYFALLGKTTLEYEKGCYAERVWGMAAFSKKDLKLKKNAVDTLSFSTQTPFAKALKRGSSDIKDVLSSFEPVVVDESVIFPSLLDLFYRGSALGVGENTLVGVAGVPMLLPTEVGSPYLSTESKECALLVNSGIENILTTLYSALLKSFEKERVFFFSSSKKTSFFTKREGVSVIEEKEIIQANGVLSLERFMERFHGAEGVNFERSFFEGQKNLKKALLGGFVVVDNHLRVAETFYILSFDTPAWEKLALKAGVGCLRGEGEIAKSSFSFVIYASGSLQKNRIVFV